MWHSSSSHLKISISCSTQECNKVTTSYCPIFTVVTYRRLRTKENFKILTLKVVAVIYKLRAFKYSDLVFWRTGRCLQEVVTTGDSTVIHFLRGVIKGHTRWPHG